MKPSSGTLALVRIFVWVIAITVAAWIFCPCARAERRVA